MIAWKIPLDCVLIGIGVFLGRWLIDLAERAEEADREAERKRRREGGP